MTVLHDRALDIESDGERREPTSRTRVSWAADRPYDISDDTLRAHGLSSAESFDPVEEANQRRRRWERPLVLKAVVADLVISFVVVLLLVTTDYRSMGTAVVTAVISSLCWGVLILLRRGYDPARMGESITALQSVVSAAFASMAVLGFLSYALKVQLPRRYVLAGIPIVALLTFLDRMVLRRALRRRRARGEAVMRTLVVGDGLTAAAFTRELESRRDHGLQVVGMCLSSLDVLPMTRGVQVPVWGVLSEIPQVVVDHKIDTVIVTGGGLSGDALRRLSWALERVGADLIVSPGMVETTPSLVTMQPTNGLQLLHWERPSNKLGRGLVKNVQDRSIALLALIAASPIMLGTALAIWLTDRGPVFYRQTRLGLDAEPFKMIKFRSMVTNSDALRAQLLKAQAEGQAASTNDGKVMFKMADDPRITKVGKIIRRFSIDELPQLFNVLKGDMALIGPRPPLPEESAKYHDKDNRRLRVKPGITGLWQVSGRSDLAWDDSVALDLRYVDNWSVGLDMQILWKTVRAVIKGDGAY